MALTLSDVRRDPVANRALEELTRRYTVAEGKGGLVLTQRTGNMKLFVHELDDLHQWDFNWNLRLREFLISVDEQRESWRRRALEAAAKLAEAERRAMEAEAKLAEAERRAMEAEAKLAQAGDNVPSAPGRNVSDVRYGALRRYLAKQFHPDHAPGYGIEKVVRNEIFKEIWGEIERLNQTASPRTATG